MRTGTAAIVAGVACLVLAAVSIAGSSPRSTECEGDRSAVVAVTRDPGSRGAASAEVALLEFVSSGELSDAASHAIRDGEASLTPLPPAGLTAGVEYLVTVDGRLLARVGISHLEDGSWAVDGWTECA